ncbi:MAG: hypothetical protein M1827_003002 [Pycnora praestabilis]|nr:MAG: hypothetical protein M1827_003002 [Pycnora praestabilis]
MAGMPRKGKPEEELFLQRPNNGADSPTVEPLRINKRDSATPPPRTGSASSQQSGYSQPTRKQAFPLPPGASSSAAPLPYPDARPLPQQRPSTERTYQTSYVDRERTSTPEQRRQVSPLYSTSPPLRADLADPSRQTPAGYSSAPQWAEGRDVQQPLTSRLAERRGNVPKPLPDSPGPDLPDKEGLFARPPQRMGELEPLPSTSDQSRRPSQADTNPYPDYHQQYWPPPVSASSNAATSSAATRPSGLIAPNPSSVNRLSSSASTSTTRAQRGSPPPPETPAVGPSEQPGGDIAARYAAAGIAGTATLNSLQAHNAAAAQRADQYTPPVSRMGQTPVGQQQSQQEPPRRPWTPTEQPGSQPHGPPTVYQGPVEVPNSQDNQSPVPQIQASQNGQQPQTAAQAALEQDFHRMQMTSSPPPAYSSVQQQGQGSGPSGAQGYPNEKHAPTPRSAEAGIATAATGAAFVESSHNQGHPAFANDPRQQGGPSPQPYQGSQVAVQQFANASPAPSGAGPASPPPLPEGWIAHMDPNSGQYYYIHLPTQSTQWEFPKGPTPLNLSEPMSPTMSTYGAHPMASPGLSTFGGKPLASPGFAPQTANYPESIMSLSVGTPTAAGFSGPPPSAGVDMYRVAPTNGVYFGPYLRYTNMDMERGLWLGSILLVTDAPQPPTIHIHQSVDLSPNPRQLKANPIHTHQRWIFYRYDIDLPMEEGGSAKWTYAITSHLGCTRYEFLVAGRFETSWRFIAHSGNDFSLGVNANERSRLGGISFMWKDIMQKHVECGGFHTQLGLGGQIYADRVWKEIPVLKQWLAMSGKENRKNAAWTAKHEEDVSHAYFHYYSSHFDQPHLREAFAQIPHILQIDDHDIFDGFGSYPEYMQFSNMFKNIGRLGIEAYLLFQHHTTLEILRNVSTDQDLFTITGTGWHFVKFLGPAVAVVGPDCRSERNPHQVMAGPTYQGLFPKVAMLPPSVQHCILMISVPLIYPRLEAAESIANTMATGKKAVTGAYNVLGKVTSSVAGVVGAKSMVGSGFDQVKKSIGKSGLMGGILSPFGDIDMLDELRDQWTHESKDLERTYLIRTLQGISHQKSLRMTFLSGAVNCCGAGLVHDPSHPSDHKTMYQIISSAVVNTPPSNYVLKLLHNNKPLYIPANGQRSSQAPTDTKEDMMEIFQNDVTGVARESKKLMGRRNYVACVAFDPDSLARGGYGDPEKGGEKLSLAWDFLVQGDGAYSAPMKYGPVIIPSLEYGR